MALEFIDGFDHYSSDTNIRRKWDTTTSQFSLVGGRFGGNAQSLQNSNPTLSQGQLAPVATRVIGMALNIPFSFGTTNRWFHFIDSTTQSTQIDLRFTPSGAIQVTRNGTVLGTSVLTLSVGFWYYLEFKGAINSSTGSYEVRINGTNYVSGTGVNTQTSTNAFTDGIGFPNASYQLYIDDLYILNTLGSTNNNFLGECRIMTSLPTGDGATVNFTKSTGSNNYGNVDETNPNDDTDYNYSATSGHIDLYTFPSISPTGTIACVQNNLCVRKDDVGSRTFVSEYRAGSTNYDGSTQFGIPFSNYNIYRQIYEQDPNGNVAWTASAVNSGQFGIKMTS